MKCLIALCETESAERTAFATIGALGEAELAAVKAWIASGCEGPQPRPDTGARRVLTDRLTAAREASENAAGGRRDVSGRDAAAKGETAATGRRSGAADPAVLNI